MNLKFDRSFLKSVEKIKDASLKRKIAAAIDEVESAIDLGEVKQLKKLQGYKTYYRIKVGDYRKGIGSPAISPKCSFAVFFPATSLR